MNWKIDLLYKSIYDLNLSNINNSVFSDWDLPFVHQMWVLVSTIQILLIWNICIDEERRLHSLPNVLKDIGFVIDINEER